MSAPMQRRDMSAPDQRRDMSATTFGWNPEDPEFWSANKAIAYRTLALSILALHLAFAVWFAWSALVVRLPNAGFTLSVEQRFWLPAMALLMGAVARFPHTFLVLRIGGKLTTLITTALMVVPILGIGHVVKDPTTPYSVLLFWAAMAGLCAGGQISSSSANISLWFPKRLAGTALGVNVGLGNLGTSVAQLLIPLLVGSAVLGSWAGGPQSVTVAGQRREIWLQNAAYGWLLPVLLAAVLIAIGMRNHPARGSFTEQFRVLGKRDTWLTTLLYTMTFGTFSGLAGAFPSLIREVFGKVPNPPDPLAFAFLGPLVGALARPLGGVLADRLTGGRVTTFVAVSLTSGAIALTFLTSPSSRADFPLFLAVMLFLFGAAGLGNASVFKQIAMLFPPKEAAPVLGFSAAISVLAFGFFIPILLGRSIAATGTPNAALFLFAAFYAVSLSVNWFFFRRRGAPSPC